MAVLDVSGYDWRESGWAARLDEWVDLPRKLVREWTRMDEPLEVRRRGCGGASVERFASDVRSAGGVWPETGAFGVGREPG